MKMCSNMYFGNESIDARKKCLQVGTSLNKFKHERKKSPTPHEENSPQKEKKGLPHGGNGPSKGGKAPYINFWGDFQWGRSRL